MKRRVCILARRVPTYDTGMARHRPDFLNTMVLGRSTADFHTTQTNLTSEVSSFLLCTFKYDIRYYAGARNFQTAGATISPFTAILNVVALEQPDVASRSLSISEIPLPLRAKGLFAPDLFLFLALHSSSNCLYLSPSSSAIALHLLYPFNAVHETNGMSSPTPPDKTVYWISSTLYNIHS